MIFFSSGVFSQADTWLGLKIEKESRCSPYNRSQDYAYPQAIENKVIESLGNKIYSPYSGEFFKSKEQTDIDHIVSLAEAHDSGLCSADKKTKSKFAKDIKNLTLASPEINRDKKSGLDAAGWTPEKINAGLPIRLLKSKGHCNFYYCR